MNFSHYECCTSRWNAGISTLAPIPIIIVSAEEPDVAQAKALALGAAAFLQKPVFQRTLVATVEKALAASRELAKKGV